MLTSLVSTVIVLLASLTVKTDVSIAAYVDPPSVDYSQVSVGVPQLKYEFDANVYKSSSVDQVEVTVLADSDIEIDSPVVKGPSYVIVAAVHE